MSDPRLIDDIVVHTAITDAPERDCRVFVWDGLGSTDRLNRALSKLAMPGQTVFGEVFADGLIQTLANMRQASGNTETFYRQDSVESGQWIVIYLEGLDIGVVTNANPGFASSYYTITGTV